MSDHTLLSVRALLETSSAAMERVMLFKSCYDQAQYQTQVQQAEQALREAMKLLRHAGYEMVEEGGVYIEGVYTPFSEYVELWPKAARLYQDLVSHCVKLGLDPQAPQAAVAFPSENLASLKAFQAWQKQAFANALS